MRDAHSIAYSLPRVVNEDATWEICAEENVAARMNKVDGDGSSTELWRHESEWETECDRRKPSAKSTGL